MSRLFALLLIALLATGCTTRLGDLTIASTRNWDDDAQYKMVRRNVHGEDLAPIIISIPFGIPNIENAIEDAMHQADGDYMTNVVISYRYWYIPLIFGEMGYTARGDVWQKVPGDHARSIH